MEKFLNAHLGSLSVGRILTSIVLLGVCMMLVKLLNRWFARLIDKSKLETSLHTVLKSILKVILYALTGLIVAGSLGVDTSSLVALFSLLGLAVSLAVQGVLSNFTSGILLLMSKPFVVGDFIEAGDQSGTVREINLIHTTVQTPDNKLIFIPNGDVSAGRIINYSREPNRRINLTVTASYDAGIDQVEEALREAIARVPSLLEEPAPFVSVNGYLNSSIEYVVRAWAAQADYWDAYFALLHQIKYCFDEAGIEMTYDHLNVHLRTGEEGLAERKVAATGENSAESSGK